MEGLVLLDKPEGITSFKAAAVIRRLSGEKRTGHTGTLDPMATGVLPILTGQATRLSSLLLEAQKRYTATFRLGITTDTLDITGTVLSENEVNCGYDDVAAAVNSFLGESYQLPPMYSALKKDGVRLYDLARQGVEVEREKRFINIESITLTGNPAEHEYTIDVLCSKGTYIRSLVDDIGAKLGCGAAMSALRRTMTAGFDISECTSLSVIERDGIMSYILPADRAVSGYDRIDVTLPQGKRFCNGGELDLGRLTLPESVADGQLCRVYAPGGFLGMGEIQLDKNQLAIRCIVGGKEICLSEKPI